MCQRQGSESQAVQSAAMVTVKAYSDAMGDFRRGMLTKPNGSGTPDYPSAFAGLVLRHVHEEEAGVAVHGDVVQRELRAVEVLVLGDVRGSDELAVQIVGPRVIRTLERFSNVPRAVVVEDGAFVGSRCIVTEGVIIEEGADDHEFDRGLPARPAECAGGCRSSLAMVTAHKPGSLVEALQCFSQRGVNLARLDSRPIAGRPFQYRFYLDFEVGDAGAAEAALAELESVAAEVRLFGTFPAALV